MRVLHVIGFLLGEALKGFCWGFGFSLAAALVYWWLLWQLLLH
jgi:hypothetical protein